MKVSEDASRALARIDALHTALTHLVLEGGDLRQIAAEAADVLDVEVVFTSTDGRERASALTPGAREVLGESRLVDATGRIRVERVKEDGLLLGRGRGALAARRRRRAPTWPGWSACGSTGRSPRSTCTPWSAWRSWPPC